MDFNLRLAVRCGRKNLALASWDGCIAFDLCRGNTAQRFDGQRERRYIEQQNIFYFTTEHTSLDGSTDCNHFIRVHAFMRFLTEECAHTILYSGHTSHAANHHHFVDLASC